MGWTRSVLARFFPSLSRARRKFSMPRSWSNMELRQFAPLFQGVVVNVSAYKDEDKEGAFYASYFKNAKTYHISNYHSDQKGFQGKEGEFFLDLEGELLAEQKAKYDVVFNHTVLEHVFEVRKAFSNLAALSRDVLIVVVPYIQQMHGLGYEDYWRFLPSTMKKLYESEGLKLRYLSANGKDKASIYLFCLGYRDPKWDAFIPERFDLKLKDKVELYGEDYTNVIGGQVI